MVDSRHFKNCLMWYICIVTDGPSSYQSFLLKEYCCVFVVEQFLFVACVKITERIEYASS